MKKMLAQVYTTIEKYDYAYIEWWELLEERLIDIEILVQLYEIYKQTRGSNHSLARFTFLVWLSLVSKKTQSFGLGEIDWRPFASDDELMAVQPFMV